MIFTTRELSLGGELGLEKKLEMQPLTEAQMRQFVGNYLGEEQGGQLLRQLQNRLRELGQTPLLLAMLCSIFDSEQTLPTNLGEVFRQFTQFYERRLKGDVPDPYEHRDDWAKLLQCLAFAMMQGPDPQNQPTELSVAIPRLQAERVLTEFLQDRESYPAKTAERCLNDLLKYHLIQTNGDQIEFRHQLIQEYYAAEYLLRLLLELSDEELKRDYLNYLKWTEPLALMLALVDEEAQALRVVKLAIDLDRMLAARLAGSVNPKLSSKAIYLILKWRISTSLKINFLAKSQSQVAITKIIEFMKGPNVSARRRAALMLGRIGNESAIEALSKATNDQDSLVRRKAVLALEKIGGELAATELMQKLNHKDAVVRKSAATSLGKIGYERAIFELLKALEDQDPFVREESVTALGEIGGIQAVPGLLKALEDKNPVVRRRACRAFGKLDTDDKKITALLLAKCEDGNKSVRKAALAAVRRVAKSNGNPEILSTVEDDVSSTHHKTTVSDL